MTYSSRYPDLMHDNMTGTRYDPEATRQGLANDLWMKHLRGADLSGIDLGGATPATYAAHASRNTLTETIGNNMTYSSRYPDLMLKLETKKPCVSSGTALVTVLATGLALLAPVSPLIAVMLFQLL